jgi:predicted transcriptional regulator
MQRITLTLDTVLADRLRAEAKHDDRPISSVARKALVAYFGKKTTKTSRAKKGGQRA